MMDFGQYIAAQEARQPGEGLEKHQTQFRGIYEIRRDFSGKADSIFP